MSSPHDPQRGARDAPQPTVDREGAWATVVWDDPVNLMTYVVYVFRTYFGFDLGTAEKLMHAVHEEGSAEVSRGSREEAETHVAAMHSYGLNATYEQR